MDVLVTTAGGIEEDLIKCLGPVYVGEFTMSGEDLFKKGLNRSDSISDDLVWLQYNHRGVSAEHLQLHPGSEHALMRSNPQCGLACLTLLTARITFRMINMCCLRLRTGNTIMPDENYEKLDKWIMPILAQMLVEQNTQVCELYFKRLSHMALVTATYFSH